MPRMVGYNQSPSGGERMFIVAKYNDKTVVVDTETKTWRYAGVANPATEEIILSQILDGELKKVQAEPTQSELAEALKSAYR